MILSDWVMKWGMKTSIDKCKVMHLEKKQPNYVYTVIASKLAVTTQRRNFTVIMDNSMKTSHNNTVFCTRQYASSELLINKTGNVITLYTFMVHLNPESSVCVDLVLLNSIFSKKVRRRARVIFKTIEWIKILQL